MRALGQGLLILILDLKGGAPTVLCAGLLKRHDLLKRLLKSTRHGMLKSTLAMGPMGQRGYGPHRVQWPHGSA